MYNHELHTHTLYDFDNLLVILKDIHLRMLTLNNGKIRRITKDILNTRDKIQAKPFICLLFKAGAKPNSSRR